MVVDEINREIRKLEALSILLDSSDTKPDGLTDIMDEIIFSLRKIAEQTQKSMKDY
jgi:hypothetical protein